MARTFITYSWRVHCAAAVVAIITATAFEFPNWLSPLRICNGSRHIAITCSGRKWKPHTTHTQTHRHIPYIPKTANCCSQNFFTSAKKQKEKRKNEKEKYYRAHTSFSSAWVEIEFVLGLSYKGRLFLFLSTGKQAHVLAGLLEFIRHQTGAGDKSLSTWKTFPRARSKTFPVVDNNNDELGSQIPDPSWPGLELLLKVF